MTRKSAAPRRQGRDPKVDPRPTGIGQGPNGGYRYKALPKLLQVDELTLKKIAALAAMQATKREAASAMAVSLRTFEGFLAAEPEAKNAWQLGRQRGRASLRRRYYEMALVDPAMMRHAAKHYLGMDDKQSVAVQSETTVKVITVDEARARAAELLRKMGLMIGLDNVDARSIKDILPFRAAK
jgi:hypothetical protein